MADQIGEPLRSALAARAGEAIAFWAAVDQEPVLLKYRENAVFRVRLADGQKAALRLHRPGYHGEAALRSEIDWMAALRAQGLPVPSPVAALDGRHLVHLPPCPAFPEHFADVVSWIEGAPLGESGFALSHSVDEQVRLFEAVGATMADMHNAADAWRPPGGFQRPAWDIEGLLGTEPLWGRFWDCPGLTGDQASRLSALRERLRRRLDAATRHNLDYGLIHADLVRENILITETGVAFIDFDDSGHGFRLFDLATTLLKNRKEPAYSAIERTLVTGYRGRRSLDDAALAFLPLFVVLRSLTYIGWLAARPEIPDAAERLQRYVVESLELADAL